LSPVEMAQRRPSLPISFPGHVKDLLRPSQTAFCLDKITNAQPGEEAIKSYKLVKKMEELLDVPQYSAIVRSVLD
ncbi:hypothetical protein PFISCL1PPCAC_11999, partial [Pristionchus fissidentatus]